MIDYERSESLLRFLRVKNMPSKHCSESAGWEMSGHLHLVVLRRLKEVVKSAKFISISADEVTAVDHTSWLGVHVYMMENWERIPYLLHHSHVTESGRSDYLTSVIMQSLMGEGGLTQAEIANKLLSFGSDGVNTFQGCKTGVATQIRDKWAPFSLGVKCCGHRINLCVETLSNFPFVSRLESFLQSLYAYFCRSNKRHVELQKLATLLETKGNKVLRNNTTRWISMRSPARRALEEYKTLVVKMGMDMTPSPGDKEKCPAAATENFDSLVDIELLLSLACFQHLLTIVHCLIKFAQTRDVYICDFLQSVKCVQEELTRKYIDPATSFNCEDFKEYISLIELKHPSLCMKWKKLDGLSGISHLYFDFGDRYIYLRCHDKITRKCLFVTMEDFNRCIDNVQRQFTEMLSASKLDVEQSLFKLTMKANSEAACAPPLQVNPLVKLWRGLSASRSLCRLIPEYLKLAEMGSVLVLGSVEDERCFFTLKFLKSCQRNRLGKHLPLAVRMFSQKFFILENFPFQEAIDSWKLAVKCGRQGDA